MMATHDTPPAVDPKERLAQIRAEIARLEAELTGIAKASLDAPASEKVMTDALAGLLSEDPVPTLKYPITVHGFSDSPRPLRVIESGRRGSCWVAVRPCAAEGEPTRTHLGIYIGDIATYVGADYHPKTGMVGLHVAGHNPAIWVPDLGRIVYGYESWWRQLKKPEDLTQIKDADIDNVFYVQAYRALLGAPEPPPEPALPAGPCAMCVPMTRELELYLWERIKQYPACRVPPPGWWCSREADHDGPCAARPGEPEGLVPRQVITQMLEAKMIGSVEQAWKVLQHWFDLGRYDYGGARDIDMGWRLGGLELP